MVQQPVNLLFRSKVPWALGGRCRSLYEPSQWVLALDIMPLTPRPSKACYGCHVYLSPPGLSLAATTSLQDPQVSSVLLQAPGWAFPLPSELPEVSLTQGDGMLHPWSLHSPNQLSHQDAHDSYWVGSCVKISSPNPSLP